MNVCLLRVVVALHLPAVCFYMASYTCAFCFTDGLSGVGVECGCNCKNLCSFVFSQIPASLFSYFETFHWWETALGSSSIYGFCCKQSFQGGKRWNILIALGSSVRNGIASVRCDLSVRALHASKIFIFSSFWGSPQPYAYRCYAFVAKWRLLRWKWWNEVLAIQVQGGRATWSELAVWAAAGWRFEVSWVVLAATDLLLALLMKSTGLGWCRRSGTQCGKSFKQRWCRCGGKQYRKVLVNLKLMGVWSAWPVMFMRSPSPGTKMRCGLSVGCSHCTVTVAFSCGILLEYYFSSSSLKT